MPSTEQQPRVALLVGDVVVDVTDDPDTVRVAAAFLAGARLHREPLVLAPLTEGRRAALRLIAAGQT